MSSWTYPPSGLFGIVFLQAVRRSLPQLLLGTIAAGIIMFLAQSWLTPRYVAEARVSVSGPEPRSLAEEHARAMRDPKRLLAIASELGLQNRPEFGGKVDGLPALHGPFSIDGRDGLQGQRSADERVLAAIHDKFTATPADEGVIVVRLVSADPELAASFVNRAIEVYIAELRSHQADGSQSRASDVEAASWAERPERPAFPRKGPIAMLGMAVALLLGLGAISAREAYRSAAGRGQKNAEGTDYPGPASFGRTVSAAAAADRVLSLPDTGCGCRIMVSGEAPDIDATDEALALAESLSQAGRRVVVVRWSLSGGAVEGRQVHRGVVGLNDLIEGHATFEEIITRLPGSRTHAIAAGSPVGDRRSFLDQDNLSLVLDTLDEVYEHIVLVAEHEDARTLFAAIEGRFDACLSVGDAGRHSGDLAADIDRFLGFDVTDIHVIRLVRKRQSSGIGSARPLQPRLA